MNIHTLDKVGFWALLDRNGTQAAKVYGTYEAAESLLDLLLPAGSVVLTSARTADEGPKAFGSVSRGNC